MTTQTPIPITLAHSPDADDMVMWWPLTGIRAPGGDPVDGPAGAPALRSKRFVFNLLADDVQRLNRRAIDRADLDITAISAFAYAFCSGAYAITACGASIGEGYGPKLVVGADSPGEDIPTVTQRATEAAPIAIPGRNTTAYLTLRVLAGADFPVREMLFSEIPGAVASGACSAGLLIHEAQLDFARLGLRAVADLGAAWHDARGAPLPLGLNVIRRDLDERYGPGTNRELAGLLTDSVRIARERREDSRSLLRLHAASRPEWLDADLVDRYLDMYVSPRTHDMGEDAREALESLLREASSLGLCPDPGPITLVRG